MAPKTRMAALEHAIDQVLAAGNAHQFMQCVRASHELLYEELVAQPPRKKHALSSLSRLFEGTLGNIRRRRIIELCAWPILDKPALPMEAEDIPEFLWLFVIPVMVTFSQAQLQAPIVLEEGLFDVGQVLKCVESSRALNPRAHLGAFPSLLRREDLHAYGPQNLAKIFVGAELGGVETLQGLPVIMDAEVESCRSVMFFIPCAGRFQVGEKDLFDKAQPWCSEEVSHLVEQGLLAHGFQVDAVASYPPTSMAEALFHCTGSGVLELEANLLEAKRLYGKLDVLIRYPAEGFAEVNAINEAGQELVMLPAFAFFEPRTELQATLKAICNDNGMGFKGGFALVHQGGMVH